MPIDAQNVRRSRTRPSLRLSFSFFFHHRRFSRAFRMPAPALRPPTRHFPLVAIAPFSRHCRSDMRVTLPDVIDYVTEDARSLSRLRNFARCSALSRPEDIQWQIRWQDALCKYRQ